LVDVIVAGAINWDINLFVRGFPKPGEEAAVLRVMRVPGGKAGNVAVAAARLLGPRRVGILGALGRDDIANAQIRLLREEAVDTSTIVIKPYAESGQAYIVTDEAGENTIYTNFGANAALTPTDVLGEGIRKAIESARIAAITDPPEEAIEKITEVAHRAEGLIAWDPGIRAEAGMGQLHKVLLRTRYLFLNEVEIEYMTGLRQPEDAARRLFEVNPDLITIMKWGKEGCTMFKENAEIRVPGIDLIKHGLRVVNTVGCGDAFLGAFAAARALGLNDVEALHWANWAGALKATRPDTRGSPTRAELDKWVKNTRISEEPRT